MTIRVYYGDDIVCRAFIAVAGLVVDDLVVTDKRESADLVLLSNPDDLRRQYNEMQGFCVLVFERRTFPRQPRNVLVVDGFNLAPVLFAEDALFAAFLKGLVEHRGNEKHAREVPVYTDIADCKRSYRVLVIDDSEYNLKIAAAVLNGHDMVCVRTLADAVRELDHAPLRFDAVLTDMEMPPDTLYSALDLDNYGIGETVEYGFAAILEATERGVPVAVVTDGNHHQGWVSAMFDRKRGATVNGEKVLFFNNIGKRWDHALKALLEGGS